MGRQRKEKAVVSFGRLLIAKAEGMGFEPTTPFGAPDFENDFFGRPPMTAENCRRFFEQNGHCRKQTPAAFSDHQRPGSRLAV
jgi:hypothetical protein